MIAFFVFASLAGDASLTRLQAEDARLATIAWRLQTANAALCPPAGSVTGLSVHALSQYRASQQAAAAAQFGLGDLPAIAAVAPESAAARAGLRVGDAIAAIDGVAVPRVTPRAGYTPVAQVEAMLETAAAQSPAELTTVRKGETRTVALAADTGCASRIQIVAGKAVNAQADGRYVQLNAAMLDFAANDDEIAVLVGHELAHNILHHIALRTPSQQSEYEADRLGVWLTVRAGYDVDAVVPFWTRFARRADPGIFSDGSHPSPKKRIAALVAAVALIKAQRAAGQPLIPPAQ